MLQHFDTSKLPITFTSLLDREGDFIVDTILWLKLLHVGHFIPQVEAYTALDEGLFGYVSVEEMDEERLALYGLGKFKRYPRVI